MMARFPAHKFDEHSLLIRDRLFARPFGFDRPGDGFLDATNDLFAGANAPQLDIASVVVTNDSENLYFTVNVVGNPIATNWGYYCVALVTGSGGCTNGNPSGLSIVLTEGMNFWLECQGWGNAQVYQFDHGTATWTESQQ